MEIHLRTPPEEDVFFLVFCEVGGLAIILKET
jgi:hypothetical protein